jgi:broad specificity phosphatase PhoE
MLQLLLARHGETCWNVEHRYQGQRADAPLTDRGREQAAALARWLESRAVDAVYSSDSLRARQTAETICRGRRPLPVEDPSLRELDFGEWEGLTRDQAERDHPESLLAWEQNPLDFAPPGGETLAQLAGRVRSFVDRLLREHAGETVLVVSHSGPLGVLLATSLGLAPTDYWRLRMEPGSLAELHLHPAGGVLMRLTCFSSQGEP